jgi:hypothetical protein
MLADTKKRLEADPNRTSVRVGFDPDRAVMRIAAKSGTAGR